MLTLFLPGTSAFEEIMSCAALIIFGNFWGHFVCELHGNMDTPRGSLLQGTIYGYQETNVGGNLLLSLFYASSWVRIWELEENIHGSLCWCDYHVSVVMIATVPMESTSAIAIAFTSVPFYHIFPHIHVISTIPCNGSNMRLPLLIMKLA